MPSRALHFWLRDRSRALDEIEQAHRSLGGTGPGRRYATQQINHAYAVLLSAQFQGFCRDLHDDCAAHLVQSGTMASLRVAFEEALVWNRKLNTGNPNPGNIGSDFNRFDLRFWDGVRTADARYSIAIRSAGGLEPLAECHRAPGFRSPCPGERASSTREGPRMAFGVRGPCDLVRSSHARPSPEVDRYFPLVK